MRFLDFVRNDRVYSTGPRHTVAAEHCMALKPVNRKLFFQETGCAIEKSLYICSVNVIIKMMRYNENRDERPPAC